MSALAVTELFFISLPQTLGLFAHLFVDVLFALVVFVLAARLEVELIHAPELEVVAEGDDAHLLHQVELTRPVEVEDGREGSRVPVEEVFVVQQRVVVAEFHDGLVTVTVTQTPQSGVRQSFQRPPQHLQFPISFHYYTAFLCMGVIHGVDRETCLNI